MDETTCRRVRAAMETGASAPAEVLADIIEVQGQVRRAAEIDVADDIIALVGRHLDAHLDPIAALYRLPLDSREGPSFLRYASGGFYRRHVDRAHVPSWPSSARRQVTAVLFLGSSLEVEPSGEFGGGALRLFPDEEASFDIVPTRGMLVAFPASIAHEVMLVTSGQRDAIVDWFY
jgi:predicted 2-oxoglutarate/Fe(II)-dependent dioxygenase YbiX